LPAKANKYLKHLIDDEMPKALKKYLKVDIFPHIQMKVSKGISLTTACQWLHTGGFQYMNIKRLFIMMDMSGQM
jgi:hypothetical protein